MASLTLLCLICVPQYSSALWEPQARVYGKYYHSSYAAPKDRTDNSYFVFKPPGDNSQAVLTSGKFPFLFQAYGHGWAKSFPPITGPFIQSNEAIDMYVNKGIAFVSVGYRAISSTYWYDDPPAIKKMEELIHVDANAWLTLDSNGLTMADHKAKCCFSELVVKPIYDIVQALEDLIEQADVLGLDVHRMWFQGSSAGVPEISYLTWIYHQWNAARFTPLGMFVENPILDLPTFCVMGPGGNLVIQNLIDHAEHGPSSRAIDFIGNQCGDVLGNLKCAPEMSGVLGGLSWDINATEICNTTWNNMVFQKFCTPQSTPRPAMTLGELLQAHVDLNKDRHLDPGLRKLYHVSQNMMKYQPKPFHLYAVSNENSIVHGNAFFYAELAAKLGLNYTVYYKPMPGMREAIEPKFEASMPVDSVSGDLRIRSSFGWHEIYKWGPGPLERVHYMCYVLNLSCSPAHHNQANQSTHAMLQSKYVREWNKVFREAPAKNSIFIFGGVLGMLSCMFVLCRTAKRRPRKPLFLQYEVATLLTTEVFAGEVIPNGSTAVACGAPLEEDRTLATLSHL